MTITTVTKDTPQWRNKGNVDDSGNTVDDLGQKLKPPVRNCLVLVGRCGKAGLTSY